MIKLKLITLGKLKEKYLREAADEYVKRLSSYAKTEIIELEPVKLPENPSAGEIEKALLTESEMIKKKITDGALITAMCIEGKQRSSEELSAELDSLAVSGINTAVFIIGGSYGLSDEVKAAADEKLSMSRMTFPHTMARMILTEQIYRAYEIASNGKYHK